MKKVLSLIIGIMFAVSAAMLTGCGASTDDGYSADAHKITVIRGRESGVVDGTYDKEVKKAIEAKFKADTGIEINLQVSLYNNDDLSDTIEKQWGQRKVDLDGVVHYIGEDGSVLLKYAKTEDTVLDVKEMLESYGTHILEKIRENDEDNIAERSGYVRLGDTYTMNMIPSVNNEGQYGIIVRKDFMRTLYEQGKITTDPEDYDVLNDGYQNMSFTDFNNMLYEMKNLPAMRYPITAKAWDINRVLGPVFETDLYSTLYDEETGKYVPAEFIDGTAELMNYMWNWAKDGIWEKESGSMSDSTRLQYFVNGWTGVYLTYPNVTNLISATRALQAANSSAEYMMIAPLSDEDGNVNGFQKVQKSFYGMILPYKADDAEILIKYLDWMYSDADNYELCLYGVKGVHWVDGGDVTIGENTYKTWAYPANKLTEFNENNPYSGMYCLIPNINVSNRIRGDYDLTERTWYSLATDVFERYDSNKAEGIWIQEPELGSQVANQAKIAQYNFIESVRGNCWAGTGTKDMFTLIKENNDYVSKNCSDYLNFLDKSVKDSLSFFEQELK